MKAKIDRNGILKVERAGEMKTQCCPYCNTTGLSIRSYCGDWCPKFEEIDKREYRTISPKGSFPNTDKVTVHYVTVCGGPTYEIIADERPKGAAHAQE